MSETPTKQPMSRVKKRIILVAVALAIFVAAIITTVLIVSHVTNQPPALADVKERYRVLIEASLEYNDLLWGEGLPTYPRVVENTQTLTLERPGGKAPVSIDYHTFPTDQYGTVLAYSYLWFEAGDWIDLEAEAKGQGAVLPNGKPAESYRYVRVTDEKEGEDFVYHNAEAGKWYYALPDFTREDEPYYYEADADENYDDVREDCGYHSTEQILDELALIYSAEMYASIEEALFIGTTVEESGSVSFPRYLDVEDEKGNYRLCKLNSTNKLWRPFDVYALSFDYSTMEMVKPSNAGTVTVAISYTYENGTPEGAPAITEPMEIRFALGDDGNWYLDSYTW